MANSPGLFTVFFDPTTIAGCTFWVKADQLGLSNGTPVSSWLDQSGNGNNATQSASSNQPVYTTNVVGSLPGVKFDGVDDFMDIPTTTDPFANPKTIFIVTQPTLNTASQKSYACMLGGSQTFIVARLSTDFWGTFTSADLSTGNALSSGTTYLLGNTGATNSTFLYQRGVQVATQAVTETGVGREIGKDGTNPGREYAGYMMEIISYNTVLSGANQTLVNNYLIGKYSL